MTLPTNDKTSTYGAIWTILNTFGHFATYIWQFFSGFLGSVHNHVLLDNFLSYWWQRKANNEVHKIFIQSLPIFICWNLWKNKCGAKDEE